MEYKSDLSSRLSAKKFAEENPERVAETKKRYAKANPEKCSAARKRWAKENPKLDLYVKRKYALVKYGLTPEQYDEMLAEQNNVCFLCKRPPHGRYHKFLAVDHIHDETLQVRRLLCMSCNKALGSFMDDPELLRRAARYVETRGFRTNLLDTDELRSARSTSSDVGEFCKIQHVPDLQGDHS